MPSGKLGTQIVKNTQVLEMDGSSTWCHEHIHQIVVG